MKGPRRVLFLAGLVALGAAGVGLTIVVPSVARTGIPANEASAIRLLRTINGAEKVYWERCRGYAPDLAALQTTGALVLRDDQHGSLTKNGYTVAVKASSPPLRYRMRSASAPAVSRSTSCAPIP